MYLYKGILISVKGKELLIQQYGWISKSLHRVSESDRKEYLLFNSISVTSRADKLTDDDRN